MAQYTGKQLNDLIKAQSKFAVKKGISELIDVYKDNWDYILRNELLRQFTDENVSDLKWLTTKEMNLIKRVINEISLVYKNPAVRKAIIKDEVKDKTGIVTAEAQEDENYKNMIADSNINTVMKQVNRYTELANHVMLKSVFRNNKMDFDIMMFDNVEILWHPDDWKRIIAVKYYIGLQLPNMTRFTDPDNPYKVSDDVYEARDITKDGTTFEKYQRSVLYTIEDYEENKDDEVIKYQKGYIYTYEQQVGGKDYEERLLSKEENPYRDIDGNVILPFVLFSKTFPIYRLLDFTTGNDLFDANLSTAMNLIHLNELIKYQTHIQLWMVVADKSAEPKKKKLSAKDIMVIRSKNGIGSVGTIDLQSAIDKLWNVIKERIVSVLSNYGISPQNFTMSGQPASGFAIMLDNRALLEMREDAIPIYREKEKELFGVMQSVWNYHNPDKMINVKSEFKIDFGEVTFPQSVDEKSRSMTVLMRFNVKTPLDYIKEDNPDLTDEAAMRVFQKNKAINQEITGGVTLQAPAQPGQQKPEDFKGGINDKKVRK